MYQFIRSQRVSLWLFSVLRDVGNNLATFAGGFQTVSEGEIRIAGKEITQTPPHKRPVNTVFQTQTHFFPPGMYEWQYCWTQTAKLSKLWDWKKGERFWRWWGWLDYEFRDVDSLSDGQQQRVAIARTIVSSRKFCCSTNPGCTRLEDAQRHADGVERARKRLGITNCLSPKWSGRGAHWAIRLWWWAMAKYNR